MVIRLNRDGVTGPIGLYRCEIPGAGGVITRYMTLTRGDKFYIIVWFAACSMIITINHRTRMY